MKDRYYLAKAITLGLAKCNNLIHFVCDLLRKVPSISFIVESTRKEHRVQAQQLLSLILDAQHEHAKETGDFAPTFRIGLSGPPGVGKSTFIERFGMYILSQGHRVAVLVCSVFKLYRNFVYH